MRYELSNRIQEESYCCEHCLLVDIVETLFNEDLDTDQVNIIASTYTTEKLIKAICQITIEGFEFDLQLLDFDKFDDETDEYRITILDDGEVFVESAVNKDAVYHDCDGFMFVESEVSEDAYSGNNRRCDVVVFEVEEE